MRLKRPAVGDLIAGVSVALVAIPQAIAYARVAGLPADRGLITQVVAPLAAFAFASSSFLQTGPTAVTSLLTFGALSAVATPFTPRYVTLAGLLALIVGLVRLLIGLLRVGTIAYLMSQPVIVGFTSAAGLLIVLSQLPAALGVAVEASSPVTSAVDALIRPGAWSGSAVLFFALTIGCVLVCRRIHPLLPGVLAAALGSTVVSALVGYGGATVGRAFMGAPLSPFNLPWSSAGGLVLAGAVIAVIGFAEPTSIARRYAAEDRESWDPSREFASQGFANLATGIAGGYPASASFSCSALNRLAGAQTRWSQAVTGLACLTAVPALGLIADLPTATLAGIVVVASVSLLGARQLRDYRRLARVQFGVAIFTFVLTLALAPHIERAVVAGIVLAVLAHLWREMRISIPSWVDEGDLHVRPSGVLYFASAPGLDLEVGRLLAHHPEARSLVVHLDGLGRIDLSGALALRDLIREIREAGLEVRVVDVPPPAVKIIRRVILHDDGTPT